jgi:carboxymethylenebutenolidase
MAEYLAVPAGPGPHPAVVLIHEWWGLNGGIKKLCDDWTFEGFIALAPDLYDGKVIPIGKSDDAAAAMNALDFGKAVQTIAAAVEKLRADPRCSGKIAITGYCMGGALSLATATQVSGLAAVVPFYGLPPGADWSKIDAPIQAHFAAKDTWATVAAAKQVQAKLHELHKDMDVHVYDADHAFCNKQRPEVYNASACAQAWERTVAFVRSHTGTSA